MRYRRSGEAGELGWLALAYIDAAVFVCESMTSDDFPDSFHRNRVPLFLSHIAVELLYKAALVADGKRYPQTHNLTKLKSACAEIPDCRFDLPASFGEEDDESLDLFGFVPPAVFGKLHERLRYYADKKGVPLKEPVHVEPDVMLGELMQLKFAMLDCANRITGLIPAPHVAQCVADKANK